MLEVLVEVWCGFKGLWVFCLPCCETWLVACVSLILPLFIFGEGVVEIAEEVEVKGSWRRAWVEEGWLVCG